MKLLYMLCSPKKYITFDIPSLNRFQSYKTQTAANFRKNDFSVKSLIVSWQEKFYKSSYALAYDSKITEYIL